MPRRTNPAAPDCLRKTALKTRGLDRDMKPKITFFDMDHTLMDNDCDVSWKEFLIDRGFADASARDELSTFWQQYVEGHLDVASFVDFQLREFRGKTPEEIAPLIREHFAERVEARIYPGARKIVEEMRSSGIPTYLLTATNEVIAGPVAESFRLDGMLATRLELRDGRYTGRIVPPYCFEEHKIGYAEEACRRHEVTLSEAAYFGDSGSDVPLLEKVGFPAVVNPKGELAARAAEAGWHVERWSLDRANGT